MPDESVERVCKDCEKWQGVYPRDLYAVCAGRPATDQKTYCLQTCARFVLRGEEIKRPAPSPPPLTVAEEPSVKEKHGRSKRPK